MQSPPRPEIDRLRLLWIAILVCICRGASAQTAGVPARSVPLLLPAAIAYDAAGDLYIAEAQRHAIRKVDPQGNLTTYVGTGTQGYGGDGASALLALIDTPQGLAVDANANLYLADSANNRVRRVDALTGIISTVAGDGSARYRGDGGPATSASLNLPRALCLDAAGRNLYIADSRNHRIRRVNLASGVIDTVAGNGEQGFSGEDIPAISASLDSPDSIAASPNGDLYIADTHNQRVRLLSAATGRISTVVGTGQVGTATAGAASSSPLAVPRGLLADSAGNLFIADSGNHRLLRVDHVTGNLSLVAGTGTQGAVGEGSPAVTADLDSPSATALSPAGLVSIADAGDQRVQRLLAAPAPETAIQTIAGLGVVTPGALSLSAPTVVSYGSGILTATLATSLPATGQVTFLDIGDGASTAIGSTTLAGNSATISLAALPAGQHRLMATYAGDTSHASAQSASALLTISPLALQATPASLTMAYGSPVPSLSGSLVGLLPRDASLVTASFVSAATPQSPPGIYPISTTISGRSAGNYSLQPAAATLVITQAPSSIRLLDSNPAGSFNGTLQVQVSSTTSGTPSGSVTLQEAGAVLQHAVLSSAGSALFSGLSLSAGTHVLSATYSGDTNFLPNSSPALTESISLTPAASGDFSLAAAQPASQTLVSGSSISYAFTVRTMGGGLSSPINLSVAGLPAFTTAAFNPSYLPPAAADGSTVLLTITAPTATARQAPASPPGPSALLLALCLPIVALTHPRTGKLLRAITPTRALALGCFFVAAFTLGCGDRTNLGSQPGTTLQSYTLTITGTGTDAKGSPVQHTATVVLKMSSAQ